ncbi:MAG: peptidyl-prolyl cis-trans isomerase [Pseudomonadota bacterium]|nr:peptidyl-prolyl cis-trans isomerase [Pseudomonadota bacterium]
MKKTPFLYSLFFSSLIFSSLAWASDAPQIRIDTSMGAIELELNTKAAPKTVENFMRYAREGFYNGTVFHRVIKNFMIQGGGFTPDFMQKTVRPPVPNEAFNGLKNDRGSIAMARTMDPHSATAQFFINTVNNDFLNFRDKSVQGWGYTVFGKVAKGMDVVDRIQNVTTGEGGPFDQDVPQPLVIINKVEIIRE